MKRYERSEKWKALVDKYKRVPIAKVPIASARMLGMMTSIVLADETIGSLVIREFDRLVLRGLVL